MSRVAPIAVALPALALVALAPRIASAEPVCGSIEEFNTAMADAGAASTDVTLTYDLVGVNPNDFPGTKGSLGQMRNTLCAAGQDAAIKVYGPEDPINEAHPSGTLKLEHGNQCCGGECGENWADPNASAVIFVDGTETCNVTMWVRPTEVGYSLACNVGQFDALGENPDGNTVDRVAVLEYFLADGGTTWELPNATASNVQVCWEPPQDTGTTMSMTVPVVEDVSAGPSWPDTVFPDVNDLAVEVAEADAYLKFDIPAIDGLVTAVRLHMHTSTAPSSDGDGGEVHRLASTDWSEATMTWNTRPTYDAASLGRIGPGAADQPLALDLPIQIEGPGAIGFAIVSPPTDGNGTHFWSKEGSPADAAYLRIEYVVQDADGDGTNDGPDCDDANPDVGPTADEACNGIDDDCDDEIDEGCDTDGVADESGSDGGASGSDGGSDDSGAVATSPLPGDVGQDGAVAGCGCTTSRAPSAAWLVVAGLAIARRRRR
jgi:MYXO-CTERM domain-containing protein